MSSMLRKGRRQMMTDQKKKEIKVMKNYRAQMNVMYMLNAMFTTEQIVLTEDNVKEEVAKRTNKKLSDRMYKILVDQFGKKDDEKDNSK